MYGSSIRLDAFGELIEVNLAVVPPRLRQQSDYNESWNMRTLIMMARAGMLTLESKAPSPVARHENEIDSDFERRTEEYWSEYYQRAVVRLNEFGHLSRAWFDEKIGQERQRSFDVAAENWRSLERLLSGSVENSDLLDHLYRSNVPGRTVIVSRACGGCPEDRRHGAGSINYGAPPAYGIEYVGHPELSAFEKSFPHLYLGRPIILPVNEQSDGVSYITLLKYFVEMFAVREIGMSAAFRKYHPELDKLHIWSREQILLFQLLEDEDLWPSSYELPRVTVWDATAGTDLPMRLFSMKRPLHVIMTAESTLDPWNAQRRIAETGLNVLTVGQLKSGIDL
jgi:hypothetical protein